MEMNTLFLFFSLATLNVVLLAALIRWDIKRKRAKRDRLHALMAWQLQQRKGGAQ